MFSFNINKKIMKNIIKILAILSFFIPGVIFAHAGNEAMSESGVSATSVKSTQAKDSETDVVEKQKILKKESGESRVDNGSTGGDIPIKPKVNNSVLCTADAKICADGSGVGRVPPSCEFAKCPGEINDNDKKGRLDDDSDNDGLEDIDEDNRSSVDSFFDVFVDLSDEGTQEAVNAFFLELGDIKGESEVKSIENGDESGGIKSGDEEGGATSVSKSKNPKEIVIVGSKVKEVIKSGDVQVRGWNPEKKEVTIDPEDIKETKDLLDFIGATVVSDENIEKVAISPERIELEYAQPAKLFGFIPIDLTARVEMDDENKVKMKFPWYTFLTKNNAKEVKKEIDVLSLSWGASLGSGGTGLQNKARRFQEVNNVLKTAYDVSSNSIRNMK